MKLLLDANISWRLVSILKEHYDECVHADDIQGLVFPAKDAAIWQYAKNNYYTIITRDSDFSDLLSIRGFPPKIVLLRTGNCSRKYTTDLLIRSKETIQEFINSKEHGLLEIY